jgi:hypothetical protein
VGSSWFGDYGGDHGFGGHGWRWSAKICKIQTQFKKSTKIKNKNKLK